MTRFVVDTNVLVYATGAEHPYREPCRRIVGALVDVRGETAASVVGEFVHQRLRQSGSRAVAAQDGRDAAALLQVHDVRRADVVSAMALWEAHGTLDAADAILAAVALARGAEAVLSADRDFDDLPGLRRVDPLDAAAVDVLLTA